MLKQGRGICRWLSRRIRLFGGHSDIEPRSSAITTNRHLIAPKDYDDCCRLRSEDVFEFASAEVWRTQALGVDARFLLLVVTLRKAWSLSGLARITFFYARYFIRNCRQIHPQLFPGDPTILVLTAAHTS